MISLIIGCECSGTIREAFRALGVDAWSNDLKDSEDNSPYHLKGDVFEFIQEKKWHFGIFHPPCTFIASSGNRWLDDPRYPDRKKNRSDAISFAKSLWEAPIPHIALENPIGGISNAKRDDKPWEVAIGKPNQIVQPWMFGDEMQKSTCLWLKNLPELKPTEIVDAGEFIITAGGNKIPKWYSDAKTNNLEETRTIRSRTPPGIAKAMAEQWTKFIEESQRNPLISLFFR